MDGLFSRYKRGLARLLLGLITFGNVLVLFPVQSVYAANPIDGDIVINEIYPNAVSASGEKEAVELYNASLSSFSLSDLLSLVIKDGAATPQTFGDITTAFAGLGDSSFDPGDYLVFEDDNILDNSGDTVSLYDGSTLLEAFTYGNTPAGKSWAKIPNGSTNIADWQSGRTPTLGQANRPAPSAPVLAKSVADASATVSWVAVTDAVSYDVTISPNPLGLVLPVSTTGLSQSFSGLTNGSTYTVTVVAKNEVGSSAAATIDVVPSKVAITVSPAYKMNGTVGSVFGVGTVDVEVTATPDFTGADNPKISFARSGEAAVTKDLVKNGSVWTASYDVVQANGTILDGDVAVSVQADGSTVVIDPVSQSSFEVDTTVSDPVVSVVMKSVGESDRLSVDVDDDVTQVYIFATSVINHSAPDHVCSVNAIAKKVLADECLIGDNAFGGYFYVVAKDVIGNFSQSVVAYNDIAGPAAPSLQVIEGEGIVTAEWAAVDGAASYLLQWRQSGTATWNDGKTVTGTREVISVPNDVAYEFRVASRDELLNQGAFSAVRSGMGHNADFFIAAARGGVIEKEAAMLSAQLMVAETKDGEATDVIKKKSPFTLEEDRDQNGIKDSEEGKEATPAPTPGEGPSNGVQDRSQLIAAIAILLILAGVALAVYSWYQGEAGTRAAAPAPTKPTKPAAEKALVEEKAAPAAAESRRAKSTKKGGKGKRKTRW